MSTHPSLVKSLPSIKSLRNSKAIAFLATALVLVSLFIMFSFNRVHAAGATVSATLIENTTSPQLSHSQFVYTMQVQCSAVTDFSCNGMTATIDLTAYPQIDPSTVSFINGYFIDSWDYDTTTPGVLTVNFKDLPSGVSLDMPFEMATYNGTTPDGYSWDIQANFTGDNIDPLTTNTLSSNVTATAAINVIKRIRNDVTQTSHPVATDQLLDTPVRYYLDPCDANNQEYGALWIETGTMVDTLPPNSTYVASQTGGVYDAGSHTVTWTVADGFENQKLQDRSCAEVWQENDKTSHYWIDIEYPTPTFAVGDVVTNNVEVIGTPYNTATALPPVTSSIEHGFRAASGGGLYSKSLPKGITSSRTHSVHRLSYTDPKWDFYAEEDIRYQLVMRNTGNYSIDINSWVDPLPCLDTELVNPNTYNGITYASNLPGDICSNPAIITDSISLYTTHQGATEYYPYAEVVNTGWAPSFTTSLGNTYSFVFSEYYEHIVSSSVSYSTGSIWILPVLQPGETVAEVQVDYGVIEDSNERAYFEISGTIAGDSPVGTMPDGSHINNISYIDGTYKDGSSFSHSSNEDIDIVTQKGFRINKSDFPNRYEVQVAHLGSEPEYVVVADLLPYGLDSNSVDSVSFTYFDEYGVRQGLSYVPSTQVIQNTGNINFDPATLNTEWIENYNGTGRVMVRMTTVNKALPQTLILMRIFAGSSSPLYGIKTNTARAYFADGDYPDVCFRLQHIDITATNHSTVDTDDWDGDGIEVNDAYCWEDATHDFGGTEALLATQKFVKGNLDTNWQTFPSVGAISDASSQAQFKFDIRNLGAIGLEDPVFYDILHHVADTGVSQTQSGSTRDTEWQPAFAGFDSLPTDAVAEYSLSTNPCRGEVADPSTTMPLWPTGCVNDWTTVAPVDLSTVAAIRITFPGVVIGSSDFRSVEWSVDVPAGVTAGEVAWNSAAATATRSDTGNPFLPTEPPKVGLAPPQTDVSLAKVINGGTTFLAGTPISTTITVSHDGEIAYNADGSVTYTGPVSTARDLVIEDFLPTGATYIANTASTQACGTWDEANQDFLVAALAPSQSCSVTLSFTAPATAGSYTNWAEITGMDKVLSGDDIDSDVDTDRNSDDLSDGTADDDEASAPFTIEAPAIELSKQVEDAPSSNNYIEADATDSLAGQYLVGEPINYRFVITNPTGFPITDISLTDDLTGFFCNQTIATLAANTSTTVDCTWPYGWLVSDPNNITNTASVTGTVTSGGQDLTVTDTDTADVLVKAPYTATLGNYVWTDTNADGVQDATETGIDNIVVNLLDSAGNPVNDTSGDPITTTTGDNPDTVAVETGWYSFNITNQGTYQVEIDTSTLPTGLIPTYDQDSGTTNPDNTSEATEFTDTATEDLTQDFGYVASASLGNYVWNDTNANGTQDSGEVGIDSVIVNILTEDPASPGTFIPALDASGNAITTTTGDNPDTTGTTETGWYEFSNLLPGDYQVQVVAPTDYTASPQDNSGDDATDSDIDTTTGVTAAVTLAAGDNNLTLDVGFYQSIDLTLSKTVTSTGPYFPGNTPNIVYNVVVTNLGPGTTTQPDLVVTDLLPTGLTFVSATGTDWTCSHATQVITCTRAATAANLTATNPANTADTITVTASIDATATGDLTNLVKVEPGATEISPESTPVGTGNSGYETGDSTTDSNNDASAVTSIGELASVGNYVWNDTNNDGVQDGTEPGIDNVTVTLTLPDNSTLTTTTGDNPDTVAVETGWYEFADLLPGTYTVDFTTPAGFTATSADEGSDESIDSDGASVTVTLTAGDNNTSIDTGYWQPSSLGNYVWEDTNSNGIQGSGESGIDGITVTLTDSAGDPVDNPNNPGSPYIVTTGDNPATTGIVETGWYSFTNLTPDSYTVTFTDPTNYTATSTNEGSDDTLDSDGNTVNVTLPANEDNTSIDVGYWQPASIGDYLWIDDNTDGVQDTDEDPIVGVTVNLLIEDPANPGSFIPATDSNGDPITDVTDGSGNYNFPDLLPGNYQVEVEVSTLPNPAYIPTYDLDDGIANPNNNSGTIVLDSGNSIDTADFGYRELTASIDLEKLVEDPANPGTFVNTDSVSTTGYYELDAVNWQLVVTNTGEQDLNEVTITDPLASSCNATIATLAIGDSQTIDCTSQAVEGDTLNTAIAVATPALSGDLSDPSTRVQDQDSEGITVEPLGEISGYVWLDEDSGQDRENDEPVFTGITVELLDDQGNVLSATTTNSSGYYIFPRLRPGNYQVRITPPEDYSQTYDNDGEETNHIIQEITLGQGQVLSEQDFGYVAEDNIELAETGSSTVYLSVLVGIVTIASALKLTKKRTIKLL